MAASSQKSLAVRELQIAIAEYGVEAAAKIVRPRYPAVDRSTFWRWLDAAKASTPQRGAAMIRRAMETIPEDVMPVAPAPAIVAARPVAARQAFDFLAKLHELYADAELLRAFSVSQNVDGSDKVKIPAFFGNSIKLRSDLLERHLDAQRMLFDFNLMKDFYSTIIEEIEKIDPETCAKIMTRLDELNRERGFNIAGQI
jgi:hypothetical protein